MMRQRAKEPTGSSSVAVSAPAPKERTADRDLEPSTILTAQKMEEKAEVLIDDEPEEKELEEG